MMAVILGVSYFVTGVIYGQRWISYLSIGWWLGAVITFIWSGMNSLLVFAFMMVVLQILPGIVFYKKFKKEFQENING
jgi:hypothetical protein